MKRLLTAASLALALAACNNDQFASSGKSLSPIPPQTVALMSAKGMTKSDPILVRLYKKESELELWKKTADGKYAMLKSFPICRWSGQLGPKHREGDRQAPEGFYNISPGQMNPNSAYYLSFDTGYPNAYDRAHNGTGAQLMVHGTCSSRGCYAMTDEGISEVYALAREAFSGGQRGFQFQAYPFRMTAENLAKFRSDPNMPFWRNLKEGSDHFEITGREPKVTVCNGRYAFDTVGNGCTPDPTLQPAVAEKDEQDRAQVAELIAKGTPAIRLVYQDGGQHETFRRTAMASWGETTRGLGEVSRPEALAEGPREIPLDERRSLVAAVSPPAVPAGRKPVLGTRLATASTTAPSSDRSATSRAGRTVLASADPDEVPALVAPAVAAPIAAAATDKPLYERMLGNVFGSREPARSPAAETEPATAVAAAAASRRATNSTRGGNAASGTAATGSSAAVAAAKPVRPPVAPQRHVDATGSIPGGQPIGPSAGIFARN